MVRKEEQKVFFEVVGVEVVFVNLEGSFEEIVVVVKGCDVIIFIVGLGGSIGYDKMLLVDLDGVVKVMEVVDIVGIKWFVMVSVL